MMSALELSRDALSHAISGGTAGSLALLLFYPLDVARTHIQLDRGKGKTPTSKEVILRIWRKHGWRALYDGVGPNLISQFVSQFVYFFVYNALKLGFMRVFKTSEFRTKPNILVAAVAGVINVLATAPLWVASTRMKMQRSSKKTDKPYLNVLDAMYRIQQEEGVGELWSGTMASIALVSNPIINFVTYEQTKYAAIRLLSQGPDLSGTAFFFIAGWSKLVTTLSTYPLQVIQNRLRNFKSKVNGDGDRSSLMKDTMACVNEILGEGGAPAMYKGITSKLVQSVLTSAFMFLYYEKLVQLVKIKST